jgi:hypothetical protein
MINKLRKEIIDDLYNDLCRLENAYLTDNPDPLFRKPASEWNKEFYSLLVRIENNWEIIIGEE